MKSIWNGHLVLGLTALPIGLGSANEDKDVHLKTLHKECEQPIQQQRWCPTCGVIAQDIVKGYVHEGQIVVLPDYDLELLKMLSDKTITVREFVPSVDPLHFDKNYYLIAPEQPAFAMIYGVLRDAMFETGTVAVAQFTFREREHLCAIRPGPFALVLTTLRYQDEVREPDFPCPGATEPEARELMRQAISLLYTPGLDWSQYRDGRRAGLLQLINSKLSDESVVFTKPQALPEQSGEDMLDNLRASVAEIERRRKEQV